MHKYNLTVGIPTFNRNDKLKITLDLFYESIKKYDLFDVIEIIVADNGDADFKFLNLYEKYKNFKYHKNNQNIGYDNNLLKLYDLSNSEYIWYFADDDLVVDGAIIKVLKALKNEKPDILLFSFGQPKNAQKGVFNYNCSINNTSDQYESISLVKQFPKVSTYIIKKIDIEDREKLIEPFRGLGWMHIILAYTILYISTKPKCSIISEILATCDDDFDMLIWGPIIIHDSYKIMKHPFVYEYDKNLYSKSKRDSYIDSIQFVFAAKVGALRVENINEYEDFFSKLNFNLSYLIYFPKSILQYIVLKFNLIILYKLLKKIR